MEVCQGQRHPPWQERSSGRRRQRGGQEDICVLASNNKVSALVPNFSSWSGALILRPILNLVCTFSSAIFNWMCTRSNLATGALSRPMTDSSFKLIDAMEK
jgi:hypothetical protein